MRKILGVYFAMRKHFHRMLVIAVLLAASLAGGTWIYVQYPKFGKVPDGARLDTIKRSPNYSGDGFQNLISTPMFVDDRSFVSVPQGAGGGEAERNTRLAAQVMDERTNH